MGKDEQICPKCGMGRSKWRVSAGFRMSGQQYCCSGCAQDTGCACEGAKLSRSPRAGAGLGGEAGPGYRA